MQPDLRRVFSNALDTFKAFEDLTVETSGGNANAFPTSIWQILNHLIVWHAYQLDQLRGVATGKSIGETDTWMAEKGPQDEAALGAAVARFKQQLAAIGAEVTDMPGIGEELVEKLGIVQELALHLSFHLGEVVLMRRMQGSYPMPHQMKAFLEA